MFWSVYAAMSWGSSSCGSARLPTRSVRVAIAATADVSRLVQPATRTQAAGNAEFEEDPTVWLFANARRRVIGAGQRDPLAGETGSSPSDDEAGNEGEEPRMVVHRTIGSLTSKQQEALRLKFQFNLNL